MAFQFQKVESVGSGIRRLLNERFDCSIARFARTADESDHVHAVRKDLKKIRAVLWLAREGIDEKEYREVAETLRRISSLLAPVRDAQVHLQTLKDLSNFSKTVIRQKDFAAVRTMLEKDQLQAKRNFASTRGEQAAVKLLRTARRQVANLKVEKQKDRWQTLSDGIWKTYKRGKEGLRTGQKKGTPDEFHEWRKSVKRLWYQVRLISPAWPTVLDALNEELARLGDGLGIDHDLFVLETIIMERRECPLKQQAHLRSLISKRQAHLRREALGLGERIYSEDCGTFCKRIGHYWEAWRTEAETG